MSIEFKHTTVLLNESINALNITHGGIYVDCTTGGGGHSIEIAKRMGELGRLICFDLDQTAINAARERLLPYNAAFHNANFAEMADYITDAGQVSGIMMDLGVSSPQLDDAKRGFSFHEDAPLDMRMAVDTNASTSADSGITAYDVVNDYSPDKLIRILFEYGEEKYARGIVGGIVKARQFAPIKTTCELAEIIRCNVPLAVRNAKNPCRKTFQAIRIEVNDELGNLIKGIEVGFELLAKGGRLAIISFHSLEDRLIKQRFAELTAGCDCPRELPLCVCGKKPRAIHITRKPVTPGKAELESNRRSRSAKLRVIEKL